MAITALPTPPSREDPANFADEADAFLGALPTFATEANALQTDVNAKQVAAAASAAAALASENAAEAAELGALATSNVVLWVSGTTYAAGVNVYSPITFLTYRARTSTSGTTDPSAAPTVWEDLSNRLFVQVVTGTSVTAVKNGHYILTNGSATTVTYPASPAEGDTIWVTVANSLYTNIINPNGQTFMTTSGNVTLDELITVRSRFVNNDWKLV